MYIMKVLDDTLYIHVLGDGKDVYESIALQQEVSCCVFMCKFL